MSEFAGQGGASPEACPNDESHGSVGCAEVIRQVWLLLDGECGPDTREQLRQHLEACPGCFKHYGLEERIKALIATKCKGERAPEGLRERLRLEIRRTTIMRGTQ
ncbi:MULTISPECIES: mycothiol system anti-sigma-R factor [Mycobacterium]|uniref:mycothiol system anti-sigma-R factor n=1 Tax=Mycobacterium TaxID=1763 RepID=UPI001CD97AEF|nr:MULTISPECIES: mycothiol system anti-sigma-R factor [Mycobacterium]MCA2245738.1 mycothiol system anti-sigma-R factor [Mycobacterium sp. WUMAC-067]MCA2316865.1 mycothiol system anti-sigma-R factor [Mycobacterium sp. WUMAC-025]MEE3750707.1 mycothiol system anti-sigma-R factor [Mycobacterium intracellulare]